MSACRAKEMLVIAGETKENSAETAEMKEKIVQKMVMEGTEGKSAQSPVCAPREKTATC